MTKGMTILYKVHNNLYVNLTNRCTCSCTFCLRNEKETVGESSTLWLEHEPSVEEVKKEFEKFNMDEYNEVVFCGFGEPTERIDDLIEIAKFVKEKYHKKIRINTNGQGSLSNGKDIAPMMKGVIDIVSVRYCVLTVSLLSSTISYLPYTKISPGCTCISVFTAAVPPRITTLVTTACFVATRS